MKQINELEFLSLLTRALYDNFEPLKIVTQLTYVFSQIFYVTDFSIYTLNKQTGEMRDFIRNWIKLKIWINFPLLRFYVQLEPVMIWEGQPQQRWKTKKIL